MIVAVREQWWNSSTFCYDRLVDLARAVLQKYPPSILITGMSQGWEQACAKAAIELGIPFWAYLPFYEVRALWSFKVKDRFDNLMDYAQRTEWEYEDDGRGGNTWDRRDRALIRTAELHLVVWDGGHSMIPYVEQAREAGKEVRNLWGSWVKYRSKMAG